MNLENIGFGVEGRPCISFQRLRPLLPAPFSSSQLPFGFGVLGAYILVRWGIFWHLGSTLGNLFGILGPPWKTMGAAGHEVGWSGAGLLSAEARYFSFCQVCFQVILKTMSESKFRCLGLLIQGSRMESIEKT